VRPGGPISIRCREIGRNTSLDAKVDPLSGGGKRGLSVVKKEGKDFCLHFLDDKIISGVTKKQAIFSQSETSFPSNGTCWSNSFISGNIDDIFLSR
jgi:hypothetical protein